MGKKKEEVVKEEFKVNPVIELMDKTRDKYKSVMIAGITHEGTVDIDTTLGNFPAIQWLLGRLSLDLYLMEKNREQTKNASPAN